MGDQKQKNVSATSPLSTLGAPLLLSSCSGRERVLDQMNLRSVGSLRVRNRFSALQENAERRSLGETSCFSRYLRI